MGSSSGKALPAIEQNQPEVVFGLVGAAGVDLELVGNILRDALKKVRYQTHEVRISALIASTSRVKLPNGPEDKRLAAYMDAGNRLREWTGRADALALLAIIKIREERRNFHRLDRQTPPKPIPRRAYVLRSLKHDSEVDRLRLIYGPGFFLVAAYAPLEERTDSLAKKIAISHRSAESELFRNQAASLIERDGFEAANRFGQRVRDTFKKADVFIDVSDEAKARASLTRFVELLFCHPNHTPTRDEAAMFHAHAAAVRSASLARQVGAAITNDDGDLLATGTNDVPRSQGGLYWTDDENDKRDFKKGFDVNERMRTDAVREILTVFGAEKWLTWSVDQNGGVPEDRVSEACALLRDARIMNLTEFGREVHAEMAALLDAARRGVSVRGTSLYCTTFPCHNCAKHIVAAGIRRVLYIEPYPKSVASTLYDDSIAVDRDPKDGHIPFQPFVGVGARRYMDLFSMVNSEGWKINRKDGKGYAVKWDPKRATPRLPMWDRSYLERELVSLDQFREEAKVRLRDEEEAQ